MIKDGVLLKPSNVEHRQQKPTIIFDSIIWSYCENYYLDFRILFEYEIYKKIHMVEIRIRSVTIVIVLNDGPHE